MKDSKTLRLLLMAFLLCFISCQPSVGEFVDGCLSTAEVLHDIEKITNDVSDVLIELRIRHWLEGGTLLGAYRFASFLPYDDDADFGMMKDDYEANKVELGLRLSAKGYELSGWDADPNGSRIPQVMFKDKPFERPHLDIFLFEPFLHKDHHLRYSSFFWHGKMDSAGHEGLGFPTQSIFYEDGSLGKIKLLEREFSAPADVVSYFRRLYREPRILTHFMMSQGHGNGICSSRVFIKDIRKNKKSLAKMFTHLERVFEGRYRRNASPLYAE